MVCVVIVYNKYWIWINEGGIKIMKSIFSYLKNKLLKIKYKKGLKSDKTQDYFFLIDQNKLNKR